MNKKTTYQVVMDLIEEMAATPVATLTYRIGGVEIEAPMGTTIVVLSAPVPEGGPVVEEE